jgi:Domain of unknown function (DUF397).
MDKSKVDLTAAQWRKATKSGANGGACVEVATNLPDIVAVRDSKNPTGPALIFTHHEWRCFLDGATNGEFTI